MVCVCVCVCLFIVIVLHLLQAILWILQGSRMNWSAAAATQSTNIKDNLTGDADALAVVTNVK